MSAPDRVEWSQEEESREKLQSNLGKSNLSRSQPSAVAPGVVVNSSLALSAPVKQAADYGRALDCPPVLVGGFSSREKNLT